MSTAALALHPSVVQRIDAGLDAFLAAADASLKPSRIVCRRLCVSERGYHRQNFERQRSTSLASSDIAETPAGRCNASSSGSAADMSCSTRQSTVDSSDDTPRQHQQHQEQQQQQQEEPVDHQQQHQQQGEDEQHQEGQEGVTYGDFQFLLDREHEGFTAPGWEKVLERDGVSVGRCKPEESGLLQVKAYATLASIDIDTAFTHIYDINTRAIWDPVLTEWRLISTIDCPTRHKASMTPTEVIYSVMHGPLGLASRDFLQYRRSMTNLTNKGRVSVICMRSAPSDEYMTERKGYVRADSVISGYVLRQSSHDPANSTDLFIFSHNDPRGLIPKWIVNAVAARAPVHWVQSFKTACYDYLLNSTQEEGTQEGGDSGQEEEPTTETETDTAPPAQKRVVSAPEISVPTTLSPPAAPLRPHEQRECGHKAPPSPAASSSHEDSQPFGRSSPTPTDGGSFLGPEWVVVRRSPAPPAQPDSSPTPSLSRWTKSPNGIRSRATSGLRLLSRAMPSTRLLRFEREYERVRCSVGWGVGRVLWRKWRRWRGKDDASGGCSVGGSVEMEKLPLPRVDTTDLLLEDTPTIRHMRSM
ncbi:unnamed protein product [Vitrella brassicaformis CCMP3155]|uniref:START domain-containing protein n=2 Tax=Vitrella brassicaformis TaxID=1169539 RepID=A0A0G4H4P2_VITBC|nr:unnamed protein product [Vitrella brassicaformis CCMP3155]|eukprot:CEM38751.1 unnamed protein product [Vitrella brassicaformis CCMP3155]